jgi:hypothetical protein
MPFLPSRSSAATCNHRTCSHRCSSALAFVTSEEKVVTTGPFFSSPTLSRARPLTRARLRAGSPALLPLPPFFLALWVRYDLALLTRASPGLVMAGVGVPPTSRTTTPPCTPVSSLPSSFGARSWRIGSASSRGSRWW